MVEYTQKSIFLALFDELYGPEAGSQMQTEFVSQIAPALGLSPEKLNAPISKAEYEFSLARIKKEARAFDTFLFELQPSPESEEFLGRRNPDLN